MFELQHVSAGYGATQVLRDVSLTVPDAAVVALLGANGAGKTTLLRVASRLMPTTKGRVRLDGEDVGRKSANALAGKGVCHVPDGTGVFRSLSVRDNLMLFASRARRGDAVDQVAEMFPVLGERLSQVAGTLSGGEQQMLALARASLSGARIALLDEVSMGLAPRIVDEIFVALAQLAETGMSLLVVEQYVHRALAMADQVYLLRRGEIVFSGTPKELDPDELMRTYVDVDVSAAVAE